MGMQSVVSRPRLPRLMMGADGWWVIEGNVEHGPFLYREDAEDELRLALAQHRGTLTAEGRAKIRAARLPKLAPAPGWDGIFLFVATVVVLTIAALVFGH